MALDPILAALGVTALVMGVSAFACIATGASRRLAPAAIVFLLAVACLGVGWYMIDGSSGGPMLVWGETLVLTGAGAVALGALLAGVGTGSYARRAQRAVAASDRSSREVDRLTGINVVLEDELREMRGILNRTDREGSNGHDASGARVRRLLERLERAESGGRRHRAAFLNARDGLAVLSGDSLELIEVNESLCAMADRSAADLRGLTFTDLFTKSDEQPTVSELIGAAEDGRNVTVALARQDGTAGLAEASVSAIGTDDRRQLLVVLRDVSSRRNLQAELQRHVRALRQRERTLSLVNRELADRTANMEEMNYRLQQLQKTKDHFLSAVSHELRTPLTSIRSFSEILLKHGETEPAIRQEFLEIINKESERLTRLVNNVLDLARIEAGELRLVLDDFDARTAIEDAMGAVFGMASERSISLQPQFAAGPHPIYADRDKVQQLVVNLLSNAIKFSPDDGQIDIVLGEGAEPGFVRVGVRDRGDGIQPDDIMLVFDKFRQVGEPGKRKPGSGLGLTICREIVSAHGGHIWVESEVGSGSTFWFDLPGAEESKRAFAARGARGAAADEVRPPSRPVVREVREQPSQPILVEEILTCPDEPVGASPPDTIEMEPLPPIGRAP